MSGKYRLFAALMSICLIVGTALAQVKSSSVTGIVTDASGGLVPNATIVVTNEETNIVVQGKSNDAGEYTVPYLEAGRYSVAVSVVGFKTYRKTGIVMGTETTVRVDVALVTGAVATTVEVRANAAVLQTESATVEGAVNTNIIASIPNINNNPMYYAALEAGVVADHQMYNTHTLGVGATDRQDMSYMRINGSQLGTDDVQLDGLSVQGSGWHESAVMPDRDALQEVRVTTNSFAADLGGGQGVIAMTTKSGTNQFHGSLDYYLRNEALNAAGMTNNLEGIKKPRYRLNEGGGSLGGPVIIPKLFNGKDKLFFFVDFTRATHSDPYNYLGTVPTDLQRVGNFSQTYVAGTSGQAEALSLFNPFTAVPYNGSTTVVERSIYPGAIITDPDLYGEALLKGYPEPNRTPSDSFGDNNYIFTGQAPEIRNSLSTRVDWKFGQKHSIYGTGGLSKGSYTAPNEWGPTNEYVMMSFPGISADKNPYASLGDTITVSPTMVVDVRYGVTHIKTNSSRPDLSKLNYNYTAAGMPANVQSLIAIPGTPMSVQAFGGPIANLNSDGWDRKAEHQLNHNLTGSVTKIVGRWTFKAGGDYRVDLGNWMDLFGATPYLSGSNSTGQLATLSGANSSLISDPGLAGIAFASFVTGVGGYTIPPGTTVPPALAFKYKALFSQNDWKVTNKLTINLGLRYEVQPGPTERYNRMASLDLTKANPYASGVSLSNSLGGLGLLAFSGTNGYSRNYWDTEWDDISPRLGAAYQLRGNTVLRGGYGRMYAPTNSGFNANGAVYGTLPFSGGSQSIPYGLTPDGVPIGRFENPGNSLVTGGLGAVQSPYIYGDAPYGNAGVDMLPRNFKNAVVTQWNFFVERSFGHSWMMSLGYVGSHATKLPWRYFPLNGNWNISNSELQNDRATWIASNGLTDPAQVMVTNPLTALVGKATGTIGNAKIPAIDAEMPYLALFGQTIAANVGTTHYEALQFTLRHAYSNGLALMANYTWSKDTGTYGGPANSTYSESQAGPASSLGGDDYLDLRQNHGITQFDLPHRMVVSASYQLPFSKGRALAPSNKFAQGLASGWRLASVVTMQSGEPWGPNCGGMDGRCNIVPGEPMYVPKSLQHYYNGKTAVTLPDGRTITPGSYTYLLYNPDRYAAPVVQFPNGKYSVDQYWYGQTSKYPNGLRDPRFSNVNLSIIREIPIHERLRMEFQAEATNAFNQTMFYPNAMNGGGGAVTAANAATGAQVGMNSSVSTGSLNATKLYYPREITLSLYLKF